MDVWKAFKYEYSTVEDRRLDVATDKVLKETVLIERVSDEIVHYFKSGPPQLPEEDFVSCRQVHHFGDRFYAVYEHMDLTLDHIFGTRSSVNVEVFISKVPSQSPPKVEKVTNRLEDHDSNPGSHIDITDRSVPARKLSES